MNRKVTQRTNFKTCDERHETSRSKNKVPTRRSAVIVGVASGLVGDLSKDVGLSSKINKRTVIKGSSNGRKVRRFSIQVTNKLIEAPREVEQIRRLWVII